MSQPSGALRCFQLRIQHAETQSFSSSRGVQQKCSCRSGPDRLDRVISLPVLCSTRETSTCMYQPGLKHDRSADLSCILVWDEEMRCVGFC